MDINKINSFYLKIFVYPYFIIIFVKMNNLYNVTNMTRINSYIKPKKLTDAHLIAEIKEINQLCGCYKKSLNSKNGICNIPDKFTLNTGHVKFYYTRMEYLFNRFYELKEEALLRNFNITVEFQIKDIQEEHFNDWTPNEEQERIKSILHERITDRLKSQKSKIRFHKKIIDSKQAILILIN